MNPAPPVMPMRLPLSATSLSSALLSVMSVAAANRVGRLPRGRRLLPEGDEFVARHPVVEEHRHQLLGRALERGDDDQVVLDLRVVADRVHWHAKDLRD